MIKWQIYLYKGKLQAKKTIDFKGRWIRFVKYYEKIINIYLDLYLVLIFLQLLKINDVLLLPLRSCFLEWALRFNYFWYLELLRPERGRSLGCRKRIKINISKMSAGRKTLETFLTWATCNRGHTRKPWWFLGGVGVEMPRGWLWILHKWPIKNSYAHSRWQLDLGAVLAFWITSILGNVIPLLLSLDFKQIFIWVLFLNHLNLYPSKSTSLSVMTLSSISTFTNTCVCSQAHI